MVSSGGMFTMLICILFWLFIFALPILILLKVLKADKKKCDMKRQEHEKEMELKQAQIDYYNSHGKDA